LQGIGGVVELVGAVILAYEWRRGAAEALNFLPKGISKSWVPSILNIVQELERAKHEMKYKSPNEESAYTYATRQISRRLLYIEGFILIVVGVVFQVSANGIAWAGAYGLFGG
jgi:hypothetical protein